MTNEHPITPPPELVHQWVDMLSSRSDQAVFTMAAQWGADQELEACREWVRTTHFIDLDGHDALHTARRPKPLSLKEQAQADLDRLITLIPPLPPDEYGALPQQGGAVDITTEGGLHLTVQALRRALEALPE